MQFEDELQQVLPPDLPNRAELVTKAAGHLRLIVETNEQFNLTRITSPREAAIKHVLDSVLPWRLFEKASLVLDAGTGPGFPGLPLAIVLPHIRFVLAESTQKKAAFVESAANRLGIANVEVMPLRAEDVLKKARVDLITARAVAPLTRAAALFGPAVRAGARALLYKGPDAELEIAEAATESRKRQVRMQIVTRYDLPDAQGTRCVVEMTRV
ncbi:16S rRNA (guanine(527)-N(7))-methyltransferase RsmG [uncultured Paludibaculum sp.]|uniref:16S rRNA (guanine(527)-N(7))-methyltransferase RsmG n=1 Tax=uncultured Paludibaculum sp. TaxID=1765020 RepID=UPI002AABD149|nr:16S rRNA (guanine(527)-N(7))-methyltransferase RsmG [uncultured Paludibaculum sp.]